KEKGKRRCSPHSTLKSRPKDPTTMTNSPRGLSRREVLCRIGGGFGALALTSVFANAGLLTASAAEGAVPANPLAPRAPHFPLRARRLVFFSMNGGPSHVDRFAPNPALARHAGQPLPESLRTGALRRNNGRLLPSPFRTQRFGQSGIEATEIYPEV